jgi:predicted nucleic acid-binding protein
MQAAVVDANVVFAERSRNDSFHEPARAIFDAAEAGDLPLLQIPTQNVMEAVAGIQKRASWATAVETFQYLARSEHFEIVHPTEADQADGQVIFMQNQGVELADAVTVAYMNRTGTEYVYSFDDDFDRFENLTRLNAPENPFTG